MTSNRSVSALIVISSLMAVLCLSVLLLNDKASFLNIKHKIINRIGSIRDAGAAKEPTATLAVDPSDELASGVSLNTVDTVQLPLRVRTISLRGKTFAEGRGGICTFDDNIIVAARDGKDFLLRKNSTEITELHFPETPANRALLIKSVDRDYKIKATKSEALALEPSEYRKRVQVEHQAKLKELEASFIVTDVECINVRSRRYLVKAFTHYDPKLDTSRFALARLELSSSLEPSGRAWDVLYLGRPMSSKYSEVGPGKILFDGKDSFFLAGTDVSTPDERAAQRMDSEAGKILRVNIDTGSSEILSFGHRDPSGFLLLGAGKLLSIEHGPKGGDELNIIRKGQNYGWPLATHGSEYDNYNWPYAEERLQGRHDGYVEPVFSWSPSLAPASIIEITNFNHRWDGDLLIGTLVGASLLRVRLHDDRVLFVERIWLGKRIRDLAQTQDGRIIVYADQGEILELSVDADALKRGVRPYGDARAPEIADCLKCHHFDATNPSHLAPSFNKVIDRPIATDNFQYSEAFKKLRGGTWDLATFSKLLKSPDTFAPGTYMAIPPIQNDDRIKVIYELLKKLDSL